MESLVSALVCLCLDALMSSINCRQYHYYCTMYALRERSRKFGKGCWGSQNKSKLTAKFCCERIRCVNIERMLLHAQLLYFYFPFLTQMKLAVINVCIHESFNIQLICTENFGGIFLPSIIHFWIEKIERKIWLSYEITIGIIK